MEKVVSNARYSSDASGGALTYTIELGAMGADIKQLMVMAVLKQSSGANVRLFVQAWLNACYTDPTTAGVAFWRRTFQDVLSLRDPRTARTHGRWSSDKPAMKRPALEASTLHHQLWWLQPRVRVNPQRWLHDTLQPLVQPLWTGPTAWTTPLQGGGALRLQLWAPSASLRPLPQDKKAPKRPCCTTAATLTWTDADGQLLREMPMTRYDQTARFLDSGRAPVFSEEDASSLQQALTRYSQEAGEGQRAQTNCEDRPHKGAGLLNGRPACCRWSPPQEVQTVHVSRLYGRTSNSGEAPDAPTTMRRVREMLADATKTYRRNALHIRFLRGEVWTAADLETSTNTFLTIRASGTEQTPILIDSYRWRYRGLSDDLPRFEGNGQGAGLRDVEATCVGFAIEGAQWVQLADLEVHNCKTGVTVFSSPSSGMPTADNKLRGPRHIQLSQLTIRENWRKGIHVSSGLSSLKTREGGYGEGYFVIGDGVVYFHPDKVRGALTEVPAETDGWWPDQVCIEDCNATGSLVHVAPEAVV